jgi:Uma2 family endonuclease
MEPITDSGALLSFRGEPSREIVVGPYAGEPIPEYCYVRGGSIIRAVRDLTEQHKYVLDRIKALGEIMVAEATTEYVFYREIRVRVADQDERYPDLVVTDYRLSPDQGFIEQERPPLLVIEVLSPSSEDRDRHIKFMEYAEAGIPNYWIIPQVEDPDIGLQESMFYRLDSSGKYKSVSPRIRMRRILAIPEIPELALTPNQIWVSAEEPSVAVEAHLRAVAAEQRAEAERQRAEAERQRAEKYSKILADAGLLLPDSE